MADVTIDGSISSSTARGMRSVVFSTASIGYWFFIDSDGTFKYTKSSDGGASWGAAVAISAQTTDIAFDVWFDQWTPGDSGTLIHTWFFDTGVDDIRYRTLDTASDTLGTLRVVKAAASAVAGRSNFVTGTKCATGQLWCLASIDGGTEKIMFGSSDAGATWATAGADPTTLFTGLDQCLLLPAMNTDDDNDAIIVKQIAASDVIQMNRWDFSGAAAGGAGSNIPMIENTTDLTGQTGFSAAIRHSDGHIIVVVCSERDTATADMVVWDWNVVTPLSSSTTTQKTNITTDIDDIYHPAVYIAQRSE